MTYLARFYKNLARFYKPTQKQSIYGYWNMCGIYKCEENGRRGRKDARNSCGTRMRFFQEHELALFCTNELCNECFGTTKSTKCTKEMEYLLLNLMIKLVIFSCVSCVSWLNKKCDGFWEPRKGVHGWVWVSCF